MTHLCLFLTLLVFNIRRSIWMMQTEVNMWQTESVWLVDVLKAVCCWIVFFIATMLVFCLCSVSTATETLRRFVCVCVCVCVCVWGGGECAALNVWAITKLCFHEVMCCWQGLWFNWVGIFLLDFPNVLISTAGPVFLALSLSHFHSNCKSCG